jgi:hypothetical protein
MIPAVVTADAGDDFSNNLFTDLAPYGFRSLRFCICITLTIIQVASTVWRAIRKAIYERVKFDRHYHICINSI